MSFSDFKQAVAARFDGMKEHSLFRAAVSGDELWETYLASFQPGSNPIYRERTEHDCRCCRQFVRAVGNVVAAEGGTIWDCRAGGPYQAVADALSELVRSRPIEGPFLHQFPSAGTDKNYQLTEDGTLTWEHFYVRLPPRFVDAEPGAALAAAGATFDVTKRGLDEVTDDAVETVFDLIAQNSLYRGEEKLKALERFRDLKKQYDGTDLFVWRTLDPSNRIRNDVIGTLLVDLSNGVDLEKAVGMYEAKVAPANYQRNSALVTPAMRDKARAAVEALGLLTALERRYAVVEDVAVSDVLFADRAARAAMTGGAFDVQTIDRVDFDRTEEMPIEKFLQDVLLRVDTVEVFLENRHASNLFSLVAPADPSAAQLFKWPNGFSWSYSGDFADSVKERVKRAGGSVSGDLNFRLGWWNHDDLDAHCNEEPGRYEISFHNKGRLSPNGGVLDVDMNAGGGHTREPVENITYESRRKMRNGRYAFSVHQYCHRESTNPGFEAELEFDGTVLTFAYPKMMRTDERVEVAVVRCTDGAFELVRSLTHAQASRRLWGLDAGKFHRASLVMLSPNHWGDNAVGNRHFFFVLAGCANDGTARGFYNEFLRRELEPHRKTLELVGAKMRTDETDRQLSGLGFSSTQKNSLLCRVRGSFNRDVKIAF